MMKTKYLIFLLHFWSCTFPDKNMPTDESFDAFFKHFTNSEAFRQQRTILPFSYILIETDDNTMKDVKIEEKLESCPAYFTVPNAKFTTNKVNENLVKVVIEIEDTGFHIEASFVKKAEDKKWYLLSAENSST